MDARKRPRAEPQRRRPKPPTVAANQGADMNELWSRSLAKIYDGKLEEFKRLAEDLLSAIRENDSETLNYAIFLNEPGRVAVIIAQYASSAGWLAHTANLG